MRKTFLLLVALSTFSLPQVIFASKLQIFPINIVNLAPDPNRTLTFERAGRFVRILNQGFRTRGGKQIFQFVLKTFYRSDELDAENCAALVALGNQAVKPTKSEVQKAFHSCADRRIVDHKAINTYLFNSSFDREGEKSSRIYFNDFEPFVFMNIERLDNDWRVWEHEFGHVFGMPELPACGSTSDTDTNIMSHQSELCEGTGGNRKLNFDSWQVGAMKGAAAIIAKKLTRRFAEFESE